MLDLSDPPHRPTPFKASVATAVHLVNAAVDTAEGEGILLLPPCLALPRHLPTRTPCPRHPTRPRPGCWGVKCRQAEPSSYADSNARRLVEKRRSLQSIAERFKVAAALQSHWLTPPPPAPQPLPPPLQPHTHSPPSYQIFGRSLFKENGALVLVR